MDDEIPWLPMDDHGAVHVVAFNFLKPPFNSPLVRRAFVHSVDREALVEMASRYRFDNPKPATNLTPPQILGRDVYGEVGVNFDPELARALFAQAGYTDPSVFPNVVLLVGSYGDAPGARFNMANALAQMWEDHLGVSVRVEAIRGFEQTGERIKTDPPELMWLGWAADYIDPDVFLRGIFRSDSSFNYGHYDNPEFDRLVDEAAQLKDPLARQVLYLSAERLLTEEDCALIPLFYTNP
jgi:ABC-type oligopeptide transport system substrate-binding subunit